MKIPSNILQGLRLGAATTAVTAALMGCQSDPAPTVEPDSDYEQESVAEVDEVELARETQLARERLADELDRNQPVANNLGDRTSPFLKGSEPEQPIVSETNPSENPFNPTESNNPQGTVVSNPNNTPVTNGGWHGGNNPEWAAACGRG